MGTPKTQKEKAEDFIREHINDVSDWSFDLMITCMEIGAAIPDLTDEELLAATSSIKRTLETARIEIHKRGLSLKKYEAESDTLIPEEFREAVDRYKQKHQQELDEALKDDEEDYLL